MAKQIIGEHEIEIPDWKPGMELLNEGLPYEECYWKRIVFPTVNGTDYNKLFYDVTAETQIFSHLGTRYNEDRELVSLSNEDSKYLQNLVIRDNHRRTHGVHILIQDRIEWMPPGFYFFLQWFQQMDLKADEYGNRYGKFRKIQMKIIQLWDHIKHNKEAAGGVFPKIKKMGITYLFCGDVLNEATLSRNNLYLLMSKDNTTCKLTQFGFLKYAYDNLPFLLKPVTSNENLTELYFGKPKDKSKQTKSGRYLMSRIRACKTKTAGFDGPVPWYCWWDEFPKTWEASKVSVKSTFDKSLEAVKFQQVINGKLLLTSYMPENADQGFKEGRKICENSLLKTVQPGGVRTASNLLIFPVYAYQSNQDCFDKFGNCDEEKAKRLTLAERATKTTKEDIQSHKRQYPLNWNDMFDNTGAGSTFDNVRLSTRDNELLELDQKGIRTFKEGHLRWTNSTWEEFGRPVGQFGEVYFQELTPMQIANGEQGSFKLFYDLNDYPQLAPILNRVVRENVKRGDLYAPHPDNCGVASVDPVDYKLKSDVKQGSLNASYGGFEFNQSFDSIAQAPISNVPLYEYNYRHEDPDRILEDMIKATMYWGFYCIIENNKGWVYTEFKKHGLTKFLMVRQEDNSITPWEDFRELRGGNKPISTDEKMINAYCFAIGSYIAAPKKDGIDYLGQIKGYPSNKQNRQSLIGQLLEFDPTDTRRFDLGVSFGYWRIGIENFTIWKMNNLHKKNINHTGLTPADLDFILS